MYSCSHGNLPWLLLWLSGSTEGLDAPAWSACCKRLALILLAMTIPRAISSPEMRTVGIRLPICCSLNRLQQSASQPIKTCTTIGQINKQATMHSKPSRTSSKSKHPSSICAISTYQLFLTKLSGESYAGKYVPDVAVRILRNNEGPIEDYINLKGILIGNGVMDFTDYGIERSEV